jgi:hypothetical protein
MLQLKASFPGQEKYLEDEEFDILKLVIPNLVSDFISCSYCESYKCKLCVDTVEATHWNLDRTMIGH